MGDRTYLRHGYIGPALYSEHFDDDAETLFSKSCDLGMEGIVSKLRDAPYRSAARRG
jgi:bifunctional non-homologous end joining protein LigD